MATKTNTVIIAGGNGSLGTALAASLQSKGFKVVILTRRLKPLTNTINSDNSTKPNNLIKQILWDGKTVNSEWAKLIPNSIVINLSGALVDRVPTRKNIDLLISSRVEPTLALVEASKTYGAAKLWLQMSTLAVYGDAGDKLLTDNEALISPPATSPRQMAEVATSWENALGGACAKRIIFMRTAIVLQKGSPALNRLTTITKWFLGGQVGNGKQYVSWIHESDFINAVHFIIENDKLAGVLHLSSPAPVTNSELMSALREKLGRPNTPRTPAIGIKLGSWLIFRTDPALALTGRRAVPERLLQAGFKFKFETIGKALKDLL
jgi:uncharacterized protein (TIGR01777 family)